MSTAELRNVAQAAFALLILLACAIPPPSAAQQTAGAASPATAGPGLAVCPTDHEGLRRCLKRRRPPPTPPPPPPPPASPSPAEVPQPTTTDTAAVDEGSDGLEAVTVTGSIIQPSSSTITNNQEAGVDEGGIVKNRGDFLVILRRGRLFTVSTAGGSLRPIDAVDAYPPGVRPEEYDDWYDEMLVADDHVVVIGYSYERGGTEINRFRMDAAGRLRFQDAHHLASDDYYSSRNYASRLVGRRLVLYTPRGLDLDGDALEALPGLRRWAGSAQGAFRQIPLGRRLFVPPVLRDSPDAEIDTLHTLISCDVLARAFDCSAIGVLGPSSRNFYVSGEAVYLWTTEAWSGDERQGAPAFVFRLPLRPGAPPSAVGVRGAPTDQFSFREDPRDGVLNVLVRSTGDGEAMWRPELSEGAVALLRLPLRSFGDGSREAPSALYRPLPTPPEEHGGFRNRFVGDHIVYGSTRYSEAADGSEDGDAAGVLVAAPLRGGPARELQLDQAIGRLEVLGRDALVVGGRGKDTVFTSLDLGPGAPPRIGDRYTLAGAAESESRSHGFFFRPEAPDGASGVLALPFTRPKRDPYSDPPEQAETDDDLVDAAEADYDLSEETASMVFLRRFQRRFAPLGELSAAAAPLRDDGCKVSCVDWYGDARPIFLGRRVFALLGYELVEGVLTDAGVREIARVNFAPTAPTRAAP